MTVDNTIVKRYNKHKTKVFLKVAILSVSLLVVSGPSITPIIPAMKETFSDKPLALIENMVTITNLFFIISLLSSVSIARKLTYKRTVQIGIALAAIGGIVPYLSNSFYVILISRACLGLGLGLFNSLLVAMNRYFFDGDERTSFLGMQGAFEGVGGMIVTLSVGQLLRISWHSVFLIYGLSIPILLFSQYLYLWCQQKKS